MTPDQARALVQHLTPEEQAELDDLIATDLAAKLWAPLPGPQTAAYESEADVIGYGGAAGGGKGLALNTPLPTPGGWTTMGATQPGDVLFDDLGRPCTVLAVSEVQHRDCYRLTFDDGTTLVADDVHRWVTFDAKERAALTRTNPEWRATRRAKRPSRAKTTTSPARLAALAMLNVGRAGGPPPAGTLRDTRQISETLLAGKRRNHAIRVAQPLDCGEAELPVPPYVLGAWLGDGTSRNGQLTGEDAYVWERIEAEGFAVRHYSWDSQAHSVIGLKVKLRELGVLQNKHIPLAYLRASYAQRLALLQGLMDTDGHAALDGGCEFDNTNETLARGVLHLTATLGIKATLQHGVAKLHGREVGRKWRVKFTSSTPVFGMPRKAARLKTSVRRTSCFRYVVACEKVDSIPTKCIAVDSPSRQFLAGEALVPTHNTDLAVGKALMKHYEVLVMRREATQLKGILRRIEQMLGDRNGYNGQDKIWRNAGPRRVSIEFGSCPNLGDETKHQGNPHDLLVFDEAANFLESQVNFLLGWNRSTREGVHSQALLTFNPPTNAEGRWIVDFFGPWIDKKHPLYPTPPGQLRYVVTLPGENETYKYVWVKDNLPCVAINGELVYNFDASKYTREDIIIPQSRTFIPSKISDNPFLANSGYLRQLQAMPEPLRSQMLYGDFQAGMTDDPWQVIPSAWVETAMARWVERRPRGEMLTIGVDVARGGKDQTTLAARHKTENSSHWYDKLLCYPGTETPDGPRVAGLVVGARRDEAAILLDIIGVGASPYDTLNGMGLDIYGVNVASSATSTDRSGKLTFRNLRSQLWWKFRELLDPAHDTGITLPPDSQLAAELCAPRWGLSGMTIEVESREEIIKRVGRSPDRASAVIMAAMDVPKRVAVRAAHAGHENDWDYNPLR